MRFFFSILLSIAVVASAWAARGPEGLFLAGAILIIALAIIGMKSPIEIFVLVAIGAMLCCLLLPAVQSGLTPERSRNLCAFRLKTLAVALLAYHEKHGVFPPAYNVDETGKPLHSWRVRTLPFIEKNELYEQYDFSEPWNGPKNSKVSFDASRFRRHYGTPFCCPVDPSWWRTPQLDATSYFAVVGQGTAWHGSEPTKLDDLPDRGRRMILLVEAADRGINWKEPRDLTYEETAEGINRPDGRGISGSHVIGDDYFHYARRGALVAFADGSVHFLPEDIPPEDLRALLTGDLTRQIDLEALTRPRPNRLHTVGLMVLICSGSALLIFAIMHRVNNDGAGEGE